MFSNNQGAILILSHAPVLGLDLANRFEAVGYRVSICHEISEVVHQLESLPHKLVLVDDFVPVHGGDRLINWIKQKYATLPLVIMANSINGSRWIDTYGHNISGFVQRPINGKSIELILKWIVTDSEIDHQIAPKDHHQQLVRLPSDLKH